MSIGIVEQDLETNGEKTYKLSGPFKPEEAKMFSNNGLVELRTKTRRIFIPQERFGSSGEYGIFSWKPEQSVSEQLYKKKGRHRFGSLG